MCTGYFKTQGYKWMNGLKLVENVYKNTFFICKACFQSTDSFVYILYVYYRRTK